MGGYTLLQNVQRVGFAPLPEAPDVVADAPRLTAPDYTQAALSRPDAADYAENGPLASVYAPDDQPPILRRDGPISAINPGSYGVFAEIAAASEVTARALERQSVSNGWQTASEPERGVAETRAIRQAEGPAAEAAPILAAATTPAAPKGVSVHATGEAWIRVRNDQRAVIFEGILKPGQSFDLPPRVLAGELRAGNAGDVYVVVNGEPFGPIGKSGGVVKNLSLTEAEIRAAFPAADRSALSIGRDTPAEQRAAALQ
jgi:cytoskeletal protein RodZ